MKKNELIKGLIDIEDNPNITPLLNINGIEHNIEIKDINPHRILSPAIVGKNYLISDDLKGVNELIGKTND